MIEYGERSWKYTVQVAEKTVELHWVEDGSYLPVILPIVSN
jgi:hypothetical protein